MKKAKEIVANILGDKNSLVLPDVIKDYKENIRYLEKKGDKLIIHVDSPSVQYVLRRMNSEIVDSMGDINEVKVFLSN